MFDLSSTLASHSSFVSLIFYFILLIFHFIFYVDRFGNAPLTGYEPNFFDDYHFSETTEIFIQESSSDTRPSYLHDSEISDDTIGRARKKCLSVSENIASNEIWGPISFFVSFSVFGWSCGGFCF